MIRVAAGSMFLFLAVACPAWAYGDPNSLGLLYQAVLPILAMWMFGVKNIWRRVKSFTATVKNALGRMFVSMR